MNAHASKLIFYNCSNFATYFSNGSVFLFFSGECIQLLLIIREAGGGFDCNGGEGRGLKQWAITTVEQ